MTAAQSSTARLTLTKLEKYTTTHLNEDVYLHLDEPYYTAGDTIYFKAYVTMGERHKLSSISGVLHVDVINPQNKIINSIKLKLEKGLSWGELQLPDSLPNGNYRVRAYTNWMRNNGDSFFSKTFQLFSNHYADQTKSKLKKVLQSNDARPDFQFFPEGGTLVTGLLSKIAFKAISTKGLGMDVSGSVADDLGYEVTKFKSGHLGMGYVVLTPLKGRKYKAKVQFSDGTNMEVDLPVASETGISLSVNIDSAQKIPVKILVNEPYFEKYKNREFYLVIYSAGLITTVNCKLDSSAINLDLVRRRLHTGVNRITLFSDDGLPLAERLFFVQNYDNLNLSVTRDSTDGNEKDLTRLTINATTRADFAAIGSFSVSVIDESKLKIDDDDQQTLLSTLLLTADLKGEIEKPNYYFNNITNEKLGELDLVMLTNGFRRFEWQKVLNETDTTNLFDAEKGLEIAGVAENLNGKPLTGGTVTLISPNGGPILATRSDALGNFRFQDLEFYDSTRFVLQAVNSKGNNATKLVYKSGDMPKVSPANFQDTYNVSPELVSNLLKTKREDSLINRVDVKNMLAEVKIRAIRAKDNYRSSNLGGPGNADQVVKTDDLPPGGSLSERLDGTLKHIYFINYFGRTIITLGRGMEQPLIIVDGAEMSSTFDINSLGPNDVESVEVLEYTSTTIYGMRGGHGVVIFNMKRGKVPDLENIPSIGVLPIMAQGYYKARKFYSPKYQSANQHYLSNFQSTVYWNPDFLTTKDGKASFSFPSRSKGTSYRIVVEGIDNLGNIGELVYRIISN